VTNACGETGRRIYADLDVAQKRALEGWARGGRRLAVIVVPCPNSTPEHYHLVPVNEELIKTVMDEGSLARVVRTTNDLFDTRAAGRRRYLPGFEFIVDDYVPAEVAKNGIPFYWGRARLSGEDVCVAAVDVEQIEEGTEG
jgi:hypothetical protein